jgi:hypothetical protein
MRFDFRRHESLPPLAWCARLEPDGGVGIVHHGRRVETNPRFFVDGAWDGPFGEGGFDEAATFTGTGARLTPEGIVFCAPSHPLERLFSIRSPGRLLFSNSLAFLLVEAGDGLDLDHPDYHLDYLQHYRAGLPTRHKTLPTASGGSAHLLDRNVLVRPDLSVELKDRRFGSAPSDYAEFASSMYGTVARVIGNAADPGRSHPYRAVSAISQGYDSAAVAALAAPAGCTRAVTFRKSGHRTQGDVLYRDDDGTEIGNRLGMDVGTYERRDVELLSDVGPQEQFVNVYHSTERQTTVLEDELDGALFMSGRHGEQFWNLDPWGSHPWFFDPCSVSLAGAASTDARLRMGYLNFPVPYVLGVYAPTLNRISRSVAMAPWRIGGAYDRPLPRRILEEAGIPRELFGQTKMGGDGDDPVHRKLGEPWASDFESFYQERVDPSIRSRLVEDWPRRPPPYVRGKMARWEKWLRTRPGVRSVAAPMLGHRLHHRYRCKYLYTFHWGFEGIRDRYRVTPRQPSRLEGER